MERIGKTIGSYVFEKKIGKGQFGEVYMARSIKDGGVYAVKCIKKAVAQPHAGHQQELQAQRAAQPRGQHHEQNQPPKHLAPLRVPRVQQQLLHGAAVLQRRRPRRLRAEEKRPHPPRKRSRGVPAASHGRLQSAQEREDHAPRPQAREHLHARRKDHHRRLRLREVRLRNGQHQARHAGHHGSRAAHGQRTRALTRHPTTARPTSGPSA